MKKRRLGVVTTSRADWGMLALLSRKLEQSGLFDIEVIICGSHFNKVAGETYNEVEQYKFKSTSITTDWNDSASDIAAAVGIMTCKVATLSEQISFDALIVLGDRVELLAFIPSAVLKMIPIFHIHGGEVTLGAIDNKIRNAISMVSTLHFVSTQSHMGRLIDFGIDSSSVYDVGSLGVENALSLDLMTERETKQLFDIPMHKPFCLVTLHPTTLAPKFDKKIIDNLVRLMVAETGFVWIITGVNCDPGFKIIQSRFIEVSDRFPHVHYFKNLGTTKYLSALKYASVVLGNSSSAIIEAPSLKTPAVNIGRRQLGREAGPSVFHSDESFEQIKYTFGCALKFEASKNQFENPYAGERTSDAIIFALRRFFDGGDHS